MKSKLLPVILDQCRIYFGTKAKRYTDNRCGKCPLYAPCRKFNSTIGRAHDELDAARNEFNATAAAMQAGGEL